MVRPRLESPVVVRSWKVALDDMAAVVVIVVVEVDVLLLDEFRLWNVEY